MAELDAELFVEPPADGDRGFRELHEVLQEFPGSVVPGFFTLPDGGQVFHVQVTGDPLALELELTARGWISRERPA